MNKAIGSSIGKSILPGILPRDVVRFGGVPGDPVFLALWKDGILVDTIGESSITLTTGTVADLANATWQFPDNEITQQAATDTGVDLFQVRAGYEWYALLNQDFVWIGFHASRGGIVIYGTDQSANAGKIQRYLGYYVPGTEYALNPDASEMLNPDSSYAQNPS